MRDADVRVMGLENRQARKSFGSSNLPLSAKKWAFQPSPVQGRNLLVRDRHDADSVG
jgi:hypothetical protein